MTRSVGRGLLFHFTMLIDPFWNDWFVHIGKLYRPVVDPDSDPIDAPGTPGNRGWQVILAGFPYLNFSTRNFADPSVIGRVLEPSQISVQWGYGAPSMPWQ